MALSFVVQVFLALLSHAIVTTAHLVGDDTNQESILTAQETYTDPLPLSTRAYWMRQANLVNYALSPCPFMAFGTVIVNHTNSFTNPADLGTLICTGLNHNNQTGNPALDGEMAAVANCSSILTDPNGDFRLSAQEAVAAYSDFTLYSNGEPCPMCASMINWAGFREMAYGTSIEKLIRTGWPQIRIDSKTVFDASWDLRKKRRTAFVGQVLANETDPWFAWQYDGNAKCPKGCEKGDGGLCLPVDEVENGNGEL